MKSKDLVSVMLLVIAIAIGAAREFLFVNLNYQIDFVAHTRDRNYAHSLFQAWAEGWTVGDLIIAKWCLAILCILLMLGLTLMLARIRFGDHRYGKQLTLGFALVALLALAGHGLSHAWPTLAPISIKLLHALQYPVPMLIVWASSWRDPR